ncbi:MAG: MarR family transcriptional regulator [Desulfobacteraceae bacterium]|nr:MarR family transcriptional regulator [Desulfobacteraceae bacterium]MCB9494275.1 MarR family transcriptional regulator [Desulfobacteraceae bacterium]
METKTQIIKNTIKKFASVALKYSASEELPIRVDENTIVSTKEAHVIQTIGDNKNIGVTELGNFFGISKSAASQMVSKLDSKGFIKKMRSEENSKEVNLVLTKLGEKAYKAHEQTHKNDSEYLVARLSTFSLSQIATLSVMLESIEEIMDERLKNRTD